MDCSKGPPAVKCNLDVAALWIPLKCKEGRNKHDSKPFIKIGIDIVIVQEADGSNNNTGNLV